jgi:NADPH-dependent ferric siderophore reductase
MLTLGWAPAGEDLVLPQEGWRFPDGKREQHWRNFPVRALACDADIRWVTRGARAPGTTTVLADALREVRLPGGRGQVWGGGESMAMRTVREHVRAERELPRGTVQAMGYWKFDDDADWEDDEE